jgi:hypothetical protein
MTAANATRTPRTRSAGGPVPTGWRNRMKAAAGHHAYAVAALPVGLAGLLAIPVGAAETVGRLHRVLVRRLLAVPAPSQAPPARLRTGRLLAYWLTSLPVNLLAFVLTAPFWVIFLGRGVLYPVFGADNLENSWGGPTLAGAWLVHFLLGPPALVAITVILRPISRYQARQAHKHLNCR